MGSTTSVPGAVAGDPEMQVLLSLARSGSSPVDAEHLRTLLAGPVDWRRLCRLAARHRLLPLLHWHLRGLASWVPEEVSATLDRRFKANAYRMLFLSRELLALARELEAVGVPCLPYKGPALAVEAYGNVALRSAGDLDVLVRRRDLATVRDVLSVRGFLPGHALPRGGEALMERRLYHATFTREDCVIEVHWAFTDKHPGFALSYDALEPRLRTISIGGGEVRSFSREDLLLVLCVHGAKHMWDGLEGIAAFAALLRSPPSPDWPRLIAHATEMGSLRVLFLGLRMARDILGAPLPEEVQQAMERDRVLPELGATACRQLLSETIEERGRVSRSTKDGFYLKLLERRRDGVRYMLHRLTTPSQVESWHGLQVGSVYLPLHFVSRPWRELVRGLGGLLAWKKA